MVTSYSSNPADCLGESMRMVVMARGFGLAMAAEEVVRVAASGHGDDGDDVVSREEEDNADESEASRRKGVEMAVAMADLRSKECAADMNIDNADAP